jgi:dethiobiotin synthase
MSQRGVKAMTEKRKLENGFFVTGTDTGIGKTLVSAVLITALRKQGTVKYWKPVQTGIEADDDTAEVRRLAGCVDGEILDRGIRLEKPLSPHLSASLAGSEFGINDVLSVIPENADHSQWIVEGAGGVMVPLNGVEMMIDLVSVIGLPAIVVSRSGLGTINHTLLTLEALRAKGIAVHGVVMSGELNAGNRAAIEYYGKTRVLLEIPVLNKVDLETVGGLAGKIEI